MSLRMWLYVGIARSIVDAAGNSTDSSSETHSKQQTARQIGIEIGVQSLLCVTVITGGTNKYRIEYKTSESGRVRVGSVNICLGPDDERVPG